MKTSIFLLSLISVPLVVFAGLILDEGNIFTPLTKFVFSLS